MKEVRAMPLSIAIIVGSLRRQSYNRRLANALVALPEAGLHTFKFLEIGDLPLYNQDDDENQAEPVRRLKREIVAADALVFVTPEYNRSIPGILKNAIDHASRPYGQSAWMGKPAGLLGMSEGAMGTALAQQHLRNILAALNVQVLGLPEVYLQFSETIFGEDGSLNLRVQELLAVWLSALVEHVQRHGENAA
jgi:chromate reductase